MSNEGSSKNSNRKSLNNSELHYLIKKTRFTKHEIKEWFEGFMFDCPSGKLKKGKAIDMYGMILPDKNAFVFVDHIFRIFDKDHNEEIDFKETINLTWQFLIALNKGIHDCN